MGQTQGWRLLGSRDITAVAGGGEGVGEYVVPGLEPPPTIVVNGFPPTFDWSLSTNIGQIIPSYGLINIPNLGSGSLWPMYIDYSAILTGWTDGDGDGLLDTPPFNYNDPGHETEIAAFDAHKAGIVTSISNQTDLQIAGDIIVNGTKLNFSFSGAQIAQFLGNYDFFFNTSQTSAFGAGGSFAEFAVIDPKILTDHGPIIFVQGQPPAERTYGTWNWVTLHEAAHQMLTPVYDALYKQWVERTYGKGDYTQVFEGSDEFKLNERYADALVMKIAESLKITVKSAVDGALPANPFKLVSP